MKTILSTLISILAGAALATAATGDVRLEQVGSDNHTHPVIIHGTPQTAADVSDAIEDAITGDTSLLDFNVLKLKNNSAPSGSRNWRMSIDSTSGAMLFQAANDAFSSFTTKFS